MKENGQKDDLMKIGELAELTGTTPRTIRLYQEMGLLSPADHSKGGFRLFSEEQLRKLKLINDLKLLDIPLAEIVALFQARKKGTTTREAVDSLIGELTDKLNIINSRIDAYVKMKEQIEQIIAIYATCPECGSLPGKEACFKCRNFANREVPEFLEAIL